MSARDDLAEFLQDYARLDGHEAAERAARFLNKHAHELAEKICQAAEAAGTVALAEPMFRAADLIRPKTEGQE